MSHKKSKLMGLLTRNAGSTNLFANKQKRAGDATIEVVSPDSQPATSLAHAGLAKHINSPHSPTTSIRSTSRSDPLPTQKNGYITPQTPPAPTQSMAKPDPAYQPPPGSAANSQSRARARAAPQSRARLSVAFRDALAIPPHETTLSLDLPAPEVKTVHKSKERVKKWKYGHASVAKDMQAAAVEDKKRRAPREMSGGPTQRAKKQKGDVFDADSLLLFKPNKDGLTKEAVVERLERPISKEITPAMASPPKMRKASYRPVSPQLSQKKLKLSATVEMKAAVEKKEKYVMNSATSAKTMPSKKRRTSFLEVIMDPPTWDGKKSRVGNEVEESTPELDFEAELEVALNEPEEELNLEAELEAAMDEPGEELDLEAELMAALDEPEGGGA